MVNLFSIKNKINQFTKNNAPDKEKNKTACPILIRKNVLDLAKAMNDFVAMKEKQCYRAKEINIKRN